MICRLHFQLQIQIVEEFETWYCHYWFLVPVPFHTLNRSVPFSQFTAMASWCTLLVQLLEHPQGISVAEKITDSLSHRKRRKDQLAHSPQSPCTRCSHLEQVYCTTPVSSALEAPYILSPCDYEAGEGFHWGCTLCYFMSPTLSINTTELTQWVMKVLLSSELAILNDSKYHH